MAGSLPDLKDLFRAINDSSANRETLLLMMGVELPKILNFKRSYPNNEELVFMNCLDYFLSNCKDGNVWDKVHDALIQCGDKRTAKKIQDTHQVYDAVPPTLQQEQLPEASNKKIDSVPGYYTIKPHPDSFVSKDDKDEYILKLKTLTTTQYNAATRNIREVHQDIQKALEHESSEAKKVLLSYDANVALYGDKYERDIKELSERVTDQIKILEKAIESLKQGRSMGLADVKKVSKELFELEKLHNHLEKCIAKYHKMFSHSSESKSSWADVLQDLKASINVTINVDATVDEDDYEVRESYFDSAT